MRRAIAVLALFPPILANAGPGTTPPLAPGTQLLNGLAGVPDPQIAVGTQLLAAVSTTVVNFFTKSPLAPVAANLNVGPVSNVFQAAQLAINKRIQASPTLGKLCDPAHPNPVVDPKTHFVTKASSCVFQFYDARAFFDPISGHFWIISAARNDIWNCTTDSNQPGGQFGQGQDAPDPEHPGSTDCHADLAGMARRFIAVAVTKSGEDLSKGFFTYILMDHYADWPQFMVRGNYLILTHLKDPLTQIYDTAVLLNGSLNASALAVPPLMSLTSNNYNLPAQAQLIPVNIYGHSDRVSFLAAAQGNSVTIYGLSAPAGSPSAVPVFMTPATVSIGRSLNLSPSPAVYRNGKLYIATYTCGNRVNNQCTSFYIQILRIPVGRSGNSNALTASNDTSAGYMDTTIGSPSDPEFYAVPALTVTSKEDIVTVFCRGRLNTGPFSARYAVIPKGQTIPMFSAELKGGSGAQLPSPPDGSGIVDLAGIAVDPAGDPVKADQQLTVWMSHVYSLNGNYLQAIGAVRP